jgi:peptidoglycan/xylan/chitin deacetylase (PgdA/CDA1 family)
MIGQVKNIYGKIRMSMPPSVQGKMSQWSFKLSGKPFVIKDSIPLEQKFPNGEKGGFIMSADFELAWAWRFSKTGANPIKKAERARANMPVILKNLDQFNIPITFATVGHLFLEGCNKSDHDWMSRIPHFDDHWKFMEGDWYAHDPYSDAEKDPAWYAPDMIRLIQQSKVKHEIGTHTFSHIDFSYKNCPADVANDEIQACVDAAKKYGVNLKSIVFPGGTWGNIEVLKQHNIKIYRKSSEYELAYPYYDDQGLLVTVSSLAMDNNKFNWSPEYFLKKYKVYIDKAIKTNTIAHFWFHPSFDPWFLENVFPKILEYVDEKRNEGVLWVGTMETIADHITTRVFK